MRFKSSTLYTILGSGVALAFIGHGILGLKGYEKFNELVIGNYDKVLGGSMSVETATSWVNVVGVLDIALAVAFIGLIVAARREHPIAYSPLALGLFGWAMVWGFLTAFSRFSATMNGAQIWDVVERGPNYLLPAGLMYIIYTRLAEKKPQTSQRRTEIDHRAGAAHA